MVTKRAGRSGKVLVTFSMPAAIWADSVTVVGDFNGWNEQATPLRQTEAGWVTTLELDAGRSYQYLYLVNGKEWHNDWHADSYARNRFGGDSSVVTTPSFIDQPPMNRSVGVPYTRDQRPMLHLVSNT
jgi:1,4-alpha-glucan branching enzyme